ncbi:MobA/MobL family protein [Bradyrhizobium liaoningense]
MSIYFAVLKRSEDYTAAERFAYQTCDVAEGKFGRVDYRSDADCHIGGGVLLPMGAPAGFADWETFRAAAVSTEKRKDGQEGRIVDFSLPRGVARMLLLPLAAFALLPFVEHGMAVRLDVECVDASDGKPNPHAHSWLAQRRMDQHGFSLKERKWNAEFRRNKGRYARARIAGRLTLGCAILGIDAYVDPRTNEAKGEGNPEERPQRWMFHARKEGRQVEAIEQLLESRELKQKNKAPRQAPGPQEGSVIVTNAAVYSVGAKWASALRMQFVDLAQKAGYEPRAQLGSPVVALSGTSVAFDGRKFRIGAAGSSEDAAIVAHFVRELDWPALVVNGGARLADLMAIAAANEGVFMVNRAPGDAARDLIARAFYGEMKAAIARHDPLGIVAEFLAKFEMNTVGTQVGAALDAPLRLDVAREDDPQSPANLPVPNATPVQPSDVAEPASTVAPMATSVDDGRRLAAGRDVRRTAASSSEMIAPPPGHRREAPRLPRVGVTSNNRPRSPADLIAPSTAPVQPTERAAPARAVRLIATPGTDSRRVAVGGDVSRTAASSSEVIAATSAHRREAARLPRVGVASNNRPRSPTDLTVPSIAPLQPSDRAAPAPVVGPIEAFEGLEMLADDDSWKTKPDSIALARDARELEVGARRLRLHQEDFDEFQRRNTRQSSGLRRNVISSLKSTRLLPLARIFKPIPQQPAEIPAVSDQAVETEELDYQAPRP